MSQYPAPYPPPETSPDDLLRPARRAGVLMIVLGVLFVSGGLCYALVSFVLRSPDLMDSPQGRDLQQRVNELESKVGGGGSVTRKMIVEGAVLLGIGAAFGALGMVVRSGRRRPVIAAIVVCSVVAVLVGLSTLGGLAAAAVMGLGTAEALSGLCVGTIVLCLLTLLIVWLIQALRGEARLVYTRQQFDARMAQYQQQQRYYQQQPGPAQPPPQWPPQPPPPGPPAAPAPPAPPTGAGGYHQYPMPPASPQPTPPAAPPSDDAGDRSDGPPAQG